MAKSILPFSMSSSYSEDGNNIFTNRLSLLVEEELVRFSQEHPMLNNLLVSTEDGLEVASLLNHRQQEHIRKVSALTSSLLGISAAMLRELNSGQQHASILESEKNIILLYKITIPRSSLCLMAVISSDNPLGQIFWRMRILSDNITSILVREIGVD